MTDVLLKTDIEEFAVRRGKVRDILDLDDMLLIVATDRISAFDCILPTGIPYKGRVLTQLSAFWFEFFKDTVKSHAVDAPLDPADIASIDPQLEKYAETLAGRSMLVHKAEVLPIECVVRGHLAGSGWKSYQEDGSVCGIRLPDGLLQSSKLPEPIFTPSTKAESGHDENISFEQMVEVIGEDLAKTVREKSLDVYTRAAEYAAGRGIILCDTKFEWGLLEGKLILVDEVLTPDSSRFWPADQYEPGRAQASFDKQFVRDWLEETGFNKQPPAPELPDDVVAKTSEKYIEAYERITGKDLPR